ncbi:glycosyltransferase [uncultured Jatrophihabitans sp.]|uniref:glycosyltransferase n=1 Tax=uncultured Jatrophihabitans sp. TaxID=1610747 RepID=UPI0035C9C43A
MGQRFGFVSTYPPTQCGLATFTASLNEALTGACADEGLIVRLLDDPGPIAAVDQGAEWLRDDHDGIALSAERLNGCDAVIVQHEFGVYGGRDGEDILRLLAQVRVPTVVVLHTVLVEPSAHQRQVLEAVVAAADAVVTMTATARDRLVAGYRIDIAKVRIIPHGVPVMNSTAETSRRPFGAGPLVLSWGLLGPGKGLEWGIEAMALLADLRPTARYLMAGETHPKVLSRFGERYRDGLTEQINRLNLASSVRLDPRYRDAPALAQLVASADVVLLPYDSTDQVTSGVLIEAVAAGKPVVATAFPHAVELLADGAGLLVPHRDPAAIAQALRTVLTRRDLSASMSAKAASSTAALVWPAVAGHYRALVSQLVRERVAA